MLAIEGRASHERKNVFDYKASQKEPPVQVFRVDDRNLKPVFEQAIGRNPDGLLLGRCFGSRCDSSVEKILARFALSPPACVEP